MRGVSIKWPHSGSTYRSGNPIIPGAFFDGQLESQSRCRQSCLLDKWGRDVVFLGGVHFQTIKGPHAGHFGRGPR